MDEFAPRAEGPHGGWNALIWRLAGLTASAAEDAEHYANGWRSTQVQHGDPESADDDDRLHRLRQAAEESAQQLHHAGATRIVGTNDTTRWWWPPYPDGRPADDVARDVARLARQINPGWWRITTDATMHG